MKNAHFHWFKGDERIVRRMMTNGYFISITPDVLYEEEIQQLVLQYPLAQLMIETDGPWPFEGPFLGQTTHPRMMRESIKKIAEIKQISINEVEDTLYENTKKFYRLSERESPLRCNSTLFRDGMRVRSNQACLLARQWFDFLFF